MRCLNYFLSGSKGVHIEIPAILFGGEEGHKDLHRVHKIMIQRLLKCYGKTLDKTFIDTSLYCGGKGKLLRAANIQRPDGNYKVPISAREFLYEKTEDLLLLVKEKREIKVEYKSQLSETHMTILYQFAVDYLKINSSPNIKDNIYNALNECAFIGSCDKNQQSLSEPKWFVMIRLLKELGASNAIIHEYSLGYPNYSKEETDRKIAHVINNDYPVICKKIKEIHDCPNECYVRSPLDLHSKINANKVITENSFTLRESGVYFSPTQNYKDDEMYICSPLKVLGKIRNLNGSGWSRLVEFSTPDNQEKKISIPMRECTSRGDAVRALLADYGVDISYNTKAMTYLVQYLQYGGSEDMYLQFDKIGWHEDTYILPNATFGSGVTEKIYFNDLKNTLHNTSGTLDEWKEFVGSLCHGNSLLVFATSFALSSTLLRQVSMEGGGLHLYGVSSSGKTTSALVAGSVCGGGGNREILLRKLIELKVVLMTKDGKVAETKSIGNRTVRGYTFIPSNWQ